ncbi:MAG: hypothetical protein PVI13_01275 [Desulfobacterales bacterium]
MTEDRGQKTEDDRGLMAGDRGRMPEGRGRVTEGGRRTAAPGISNWGSYLLGFGWMRIFVRMIFIANCPCFLIWIISGLYQV